ncbi:hypothetical protein NHQ30_008179 [Ciborinia camelliae]|nr:hypothetical protein NHQ30_008179 [Ciborinia camelliae]
MTDQFYGGKPLDIKLLLTQKKAEHFKALQEAKAKALQDAAIEKAPATSTVINAGILISPATAPPAWDYNHITSYYDEDITKATSFDSAKEASTNTTCILSSEKPIGIDNQPQIRSSTNPKPLKRESFQSGVSLSSIILKSIEPDKRRFFQPLADAITASGADQLGKILLRLCVEHPNTRAVVESLLADASDEDFIHNSPALIRKSSNCNDKQTPQKPTTTPLLPVEKQNKRLEEEQRPLAITKSTKKVPQIPPKAIPAQTLVASEKRKREQSPDIAVVSQKKPKPFDKFAIPIPQRSNFDGSSNNYQDGIITPSKSLSNSLNTSECLKFTQTSKSSLGSLFGSDDSEKESSSGKHVCAVSYCPKPTPMQRSLDRHMKTIHKSEGEPLGCSLCPKKFVRRDYVYRHLDASHTSSDLKCLACGLQYQDGDSLSTHMRSEHGVLHVEDKTANASSTIPTRVKKVVSFQDEPIKFRKY